MPNALSKLLPDTCDDVLMDFMPIHEVLRFALVCREAKTRVASYLRRRFRIYDALRPFMAEQSFESFRRLMAKCQMVISGSVALQFFSRTSWNDSDMDLYVDEKFTSIVSAWFKEPEYTLISGALVSICRRRPAGLENEEASSVLEFDPTTFGGYAGIRTVITYRREANGRTIQIISCGGTPVQTIIKFHSTAVVNILTHDAAYCVYPRPTLIRKISLFQPFEVTQQVFAALQKYRDRGWTVVQHLAMTHGFDYAGLFPFGPRRIGDSKTFKITFPNSTPPYHDDTIESNAWTVSYDGHMQPHLSAVLVRSERVAFSYIIRSDRTREELTNRWNQIKALQPTKRWSPIDVQQEAEGDTGHGWYSHHLKQRRVIVLLSRV